MNVLVYVCMYVQYVHVCVYLTSVCTGSDRSQWQLTRRFFLSQSVTNSPSYASHMHLRYTCIMCQDVNH